jgi:hypothetical protein
MTYVLKNSRPQPECAAINVAEAAAIFDRSTSWVRDRLTDNSLEAAECSNSRRIAITVKSVIRLSETIAGSRSARSKARRPWLRLVVDNDLK